MHDDTCLYMLVIIDECLSDDWFSIVCGLNELKDWDSVVIIFI